MVSRGIALPGGANVPGVRTSTLEGCPIGRIVSNRFATGIQISAAPKSRTLTREEIICQTWSQEFTRDGTYA